MLKERTSNDTSNTRDTEPEGLAFIIYEEIDEEQAVKELDHHVDRRLYAHTK